MTLKPIILYSHKNGPNPWKVAIFLHELNVPYETKFLEFGTAENGVKSAAYLKINPNGRVPAIVDPNNDGVVVWESGAILLYLQKRYDTENKFGAKTAQDEADILAYLFLQVSGLGPSQGQVNWFIHYQPGEKIVPAIERYTNETKRLYKVIDDRLQGRQFFVSDHFTLVDAAFFPWVRITPHAKLDHDTVIKTEFPNVYAWFKRISERPSVVAAYAEAK
jgi:glutathione S-transferase